MFGYSANPIASYKKNETDIAVASSDPHHLVQLLFDGALQGISMARIHMEGGNIAEKGRYISQVLDIVNNGLKASLKLDDGSELTRNLDALYGYIATRLLIANLHNDMAALDEVHGLLSEIGSAWSEIAPGRAGG